MISFTSFEYVLIDIANAFGKDKLLFEERIQWVKDHINELETLVKDADSAPLYIKGVMALRKIQKGLPTGHIVGMDATCSGIQVMSALTGCVAGATATGLVDPNVRADAYTQCTNEMIRLLNSPGLVLSVSRQQAKDALMTMMYGSKKRPKEIFGEDTPELEAFYTAAQIVAPGAYDLLQILLESWQAYELLHEWKLPDGYDARVKVMDKITTRIEVDELDHATFTYEYKENVGLLKGKANAANVVHSVDAFILREIHRRCNYDAITMYYVVDEMLAERAHRDSSQTAGNPIDAMVVGSSLAYYIEQYERTGMPSAVIFGELLGEYSVRYLSDAHLNSLIEIAQRMQTHKSFEVVTIHDEFKCSPVNMNALRQHYIDIFAQLAESNVLEDILSQIHGRPCRYTKLSDDLGDLIRNSSYALC